VPTPVEAITEQKWLEWYNWLSGQVSGGTWGVAHADRLLSVARRFVRFLWELRLIELPRNLDNRQLAFTQSPKQVEIFSVEEVQKLYATATGQSKLHVLLMLNCGFQGMDVATLGQNEVDWTAGVITRKRTKTRMEKNVPVVRYKLWVRTFELLKQWRSEDPDVVLLTLKGNRWIKEKLAEKYSKSDMVGRNLDYWLERAGLDHR
jgi:integrase